jgi:hypothetical protein
VIFRGEPLRNLIQNFVWLVQDRVVRESQHSEALTNHVYVPVSVVLPLLVVFMDRAIALNYETGFATKEICQVLTELMLSSELKPQKTPIAQ